MNSTLIDNKEYQFRRFKKGDEKAFDFFFKLYYNQIVGFCIQFIGDRDKAKSIGQEAYVNLWVNRKKVRKIEGIKSFLYTSAKSDCLNLLRHQKVISKYKDNYIREKEGQLNIEVLNSMNFDAVMFSELEELIKTSIKKLPEKCKRVFVMRRIDNKKNNEIAMELNISVKAVEANMTRALKYLRYSLSDYISVLLIGIVLHSL